MIFSSIFFHIVDAELSDLLLKYRTSRNAQRFRLLIFILIVARRFSRKEAGNFSSQVQVVSKSAGTLWPSNSANNLAFVSASCNNEKLGIGNPSSCFWNCPTRLNGNPWKPWLRHCMGIAWRNNHRRMILQTCWRICSVVLSRHPSLRYWWANRPPFTMQELKHALGRLKTNKSLQIRWWGRFGCLTSTGCPCRVIRSRLVVLQSCVDFGWRASGMA